MKAGYANFPGYGNTPNGGIQGFEDIFNHSVNLNYCNDLGDCDAIILWGGEDIATSLYHEPVAHTYGTTHASDRDVFEWELMRLAKKKDIPIIGICRGAQIMCAFAGGKLAQDVSGHQFNHDVITKDGEVFKAVSSSHHQMMYPFSIKHEVLAWTPTPLSERYEGLSKKQAAHYSKGEPEVVYFPQIRGLGVQIHPEWHKNHPFNTWLKSQILSKLYGESVCV